MKNVTSIVATYIKENGITLRYVCQKTGLSKNIVYPSLGDKQSRKLRVDEFFLICNALSIDPMELVNMDDFKPVSIQEAS